MIGELSSGFLGFGTIWVAPGFGFVELGAGCDNWVFGGFCGGVIGGSFGGWEFGGGGVLTILSSGRPASI